MKYMRLVCVAVVLLACSGHNPAGPSLGNGAIRNVWSPYLGIHPFDWQTGIMQPHLATLMDNAPVRGLRFDANDPVTVRALTTWARSHGAQDFIGIFPNVYLREPYVTEIFDATVRACPDVEYWEIGNEVGLFEGMSMSEYMPIFLELYEYAHQNHPELVLIAHPPAGTSDGASDFEAMVRGSLGALARDPDPTRRLKVVSIHIYNTEDGLIRKLQRVVALLPSTTEVWVTETGFPSLDGVGQTAYMMESYPRIRNFLRASRIYWYVFSECERYAMVRGLAETCTEPIRYSDLYRDLTGSVEP